MFGHQLDHGHLTYLICEPKLRRTTQIILVHLLRTKGLGFSFSFVLVYYDCCSVSLLFPLIFPPLPEREDLLYFHFKSRQTGVASELMCQLTKPVKLDSLTQYLLPEFKEAKIVCVKR